ncbi:MAG: Gfo/Idh/MocA family oxidoreductase [Planctomycetaceae bacterium]|jgi:predicted dehydrogenase|nr:Gfo/Idh/MocA family oxidoreductase [Planctomycetaceae bacterium]
MTISRRHFLSASVLTAAAVSFPTPAIFGTEKDKKYRVALVGCGWWGTNILNAALASKTVEPVALVDVDKRQLETELKNVKDKTGLEPKIFGDFREMLKQIKPDIVINATPDHWHALITIAACNAGAHVYVEKPICHTINEGIAMVKTARETKRTVQVGTHRRVSPHNQAAMEFLKSGKLGKIGHVRAFVNYPGGTGRATPDAPVPDGLDWDFWCGPAPLLPYNPRIHPKGFRQFMEFANGQISDWGIHWLDQVLWWSQEEQYPKSVASTGGRFVLEDNSTWYDTQHVVYQFEKFDLAWEHRLYSGNPPEKHNIGIYFYGTNGVLHLGWQDGWSYYPNGTNKEPAEHGEPKLDKPDDQNIANLWADFIDAIQTGRKPIADIENGHRSTTLALLGVLSQKLGRGIVWDGKNQTTPNDPEAVKLLARKYREPWKYPE